MSVITPPKMIAGGSFIVAWLDPPARVAYAGMLASAAPAPALKAIGERLRGTLPESAWSELAAAVPSLA